MTKEKKSSYRLPRIAAIALLLCIAGFSGWRMLSLPLWGWWPLVFLLAGWMAIALLFFPKDPSGKKWWGAATLSGVLLGLGFPPSPLTWVVFFAWIPILAMENGIYLQKEKPDPKRVWLYSFHAFALWNIIATFWVANTAFLAGIFANFVNAALMATVMMMVHITRHYFPKRVFPWILISFWISFEFLHYHWDLSWPWLTLGNSLSQYPWAVQWYEYTGVFGGSLWILLVNYSADNIINRWLRAKPIQLWRYVGLAFIPLCLSLYLWYTTKEGDAKPVNVTIVQPNFEPHYEKFDIPEREQVLRFYELSEQNVDSTTDYLVFPETSFEGVHLNEFRDNRAVQLFQSMLDSFPHLHLVAGISSYRTLQPDQLAGANYRVYTRKSGDIVYWDVQNSAIELASNQQDYQVYFKSKLVPGPEIFPFRNVLFFMKPLVEKLGGTYEGHTTQPHRSVFKGGPLTVAPMICYESIFGAYTGEYVREGATALFIVTNDGWWDNTPGHIQHLKIGALRAIEHRRPIARSANTGISAFIDIKGRIHQPTLYRETTAIRGEIIPETRITFYTRWGDIIAKTAVLMSCVLLLLGMRYYFQRKWKVS